MPATEVYFYRAGDSTPVLDWLEKLGRIGTTKKALAKLRVLIELLETKGHELRRPHADILRNGIHELRTRYRRVQYRILYFFAAKNVAVLTHAIVKPGAEVPSEDIAMACVRKAIYMKKPKEHKYVEEEGDA